RVLCPGDVPGVSHEAPELGNRDRMPVDREAADRNFANRPLLGIEAVAAHPERPARQLDHVLHAETVFQVVLVLRGRHSRMSISSASRSRSRYGSPLTSIPSRSIVPPVKRCGAGPGKSSVSGSPSWRPTYKPEPAMANAPSWVLISASPTFSSPW